MGVLRTMVGPALRYGCAIRRCLTSLLRGHVGNGVTEWYSNGTPPPVTAGDAKVEGLSNSHCGGREFESPHLHQISWEAPEGA